MPFPEIFQQFFLRGKEIHLIENGDHSCFSIEELLYKFFLKLSPLIRLCDDKSHIQPVHDFPAFFLPQITDKKCIIIQSGSINKKDGPQRMYFHRLFHRVGSCSGNRGNDRNLLIGKRIEKRGFSGIAFTEKTDLQAQTFWCFKHFCRLLPVFTLSEF